MGNKLGINNSHTYKTSETGNVNFINTYIKPENATHITKIKENKLKPNEEFIKKYFTGKKNKSFM
ncbi:MAG: hypothetical protein NC541_08530 [bacterium]|nr:hypothetical protein [bacterium]